MVDFFSDNSWREEISNKIRHKCTLPDSNHGCILWEGCVFQPSGYAKLAVRWNNNNRKYFRVHRLVYMFEHHLKSIPTQNPEGRKLEISHICHQKLCVCANHLSLEPHETNMERMHCKLQGSCSKNHMPLCLIVSIK